MRARTRLLVGVRGDPQQELVHRGDVLLDEGVDAHHVGFWRSREVNEDRSALHLEGAYP